MQAYENALTRFVMYEKDKTTTEKKKFDTFSVPLTPSLGVTQISIGDILPWIIYSTITALR